MGADRLAGRKTLQVSGYLQELEKDQLKARTDLVELFAGFGVELARRGKSHVGRCPWHDDAEPSLSVDGERGLYHCFGCGEAGDAITLVRKMRGCSFAEALQFLQGGQQQRGQANGTRPQASPSPPAPTPRTRPRAPRKDSARVSLDEIAAYYQQRLATSREAKNYLGSRGLGDAQLAARFQLGFADGSLLKRASATQAAELESLGVVNSREREHFARCIVFPLHDADGKVSGLYGRSIDAAAKRPHLYLPGPHRGVWNRQASRVHESIILSESVIDGLSLVALGLQNVQALYGAGGLTAEHRQLLQADRVQELVLALDGDQAGRRAAERLSTEMLADGFTVKTLFPSSGKDWNEFLQAGGEATTVQELLAKAQPLSPAATETKLGREGIYRVARCGELSYRLAGVKELFVGSLRVNVRAERAGRSERFYDNVELYSARSRGAYAAALAARLEVEPRRVEADLVGILEQLEAERDRLLAAASGHGDERQVPSGAEHEQALALLQSPELVEQIDRDLSTLGYVGERHNKLLVYLAATSRKLTDPISVLLVSESAAGKSLLIETVRRLMPPEDVVAVTSLSDQALNYLPAGDLEHKLLILGEAVHSEQIEHQVREMLSARELSRMVVMKDEKTGELATRTVRTRAVVSAMMSCTNRAINPENASRFFLLSADESAQQTRRIHAAQREKYSLERQRQLSQAVPELVATHQAAQRLLEPLPIVNPFAELLDFPDRLLRTRRDHERFLDLIAVVCFVRQFQKQIEVTEEGLRYLRCDLADYRIAHELIGGALSTTLADLPSGARELYAALGQLASQRAQQLALAPGEVELTQREIREATGLSHMFVKRSLRALVDYEYVQARGARQRGARLRYTLSSAAPLESADLQRIPSPQAMAAKLGRGGSQAGRPGEER